MDHPLLAPYLCAWRPQRLCLAFANADGLWLWEPAMPPRRLTDDCSLNALSWSPTGALALSADDGFCGVKVLDGSGARRWEQDPAAGRLDELEFSPCGRFLACFGDHTAVLDASSGQTLWQRQRRTPGVASFAGARQTQHRDAVAMPDDGVWNGDHLLVRYGDAYEVLDERGTVVEQGPQHRDAFVGWRNNAIVHRSLALDDAFARSFTYSVDGRHAAAEGKDHGVWVQMEATPTVCIAGHPRTITALVWSPDNQLYTGCRDGWVRRLVDRRFEPVTQLASPVYGISWAFDGTGIAFATQSTLTLRL